VFITIFVVVVLTILLHLLRNFFWRICVLENTGVRESLQRGFAMVLENWKNVGLMWLVMVGLGIVWAIVSIILFIVTIPLVVVTAVCRPGSSSPYLLLVGAFSLFSTAYCRGLHGFVRCAIILHHRLLALASVGQLADGVHLHSLDVDLP
jgi:hypothetical protein